MMSSMNGSPLSGGRYLYDVSSGNVPGRRKSFRTSSQNIPCLGELSLSPLVALRTMDSQVPGSDLYGVKELDWTQHDVDPDRSQYGDLLLSDFLPASQVRPMKHRLTQPLFASRSNSSSSVKTENLSAMMSPQLTQIKISASPLESFPPPLQLSDAKAAAPIPAPAVEYNTKSLQEQLRQKQKQKEKSAFQSVAVRPLPAGSPHDALDMSLINNPVLVQYLRNPIFKRVFINELEADLKESESSLAAKGSEQAQENIGQSPKQTSETEGNCSKKHSQDASRPRTSKSSKKRKSKAGRAKSSRPAKRRGRKPASGGKAASEVREFRCQHPDCGDSFPTQFSLKRHSKRHSGLRPFTCTWTNPETGVLCTMAFAEKSTLKRHLQMHDGKKPYVCKLCDRCFADRINLKRHLENHAKHTVPAPKKQAAKPKSQPKSQPQPQPQPEA